MAGGILGLGSGQAASLNQDMIDKLKAAEKKAKVDPIDKSIENLETEKKTFSDIQSKVSELLSSIKPFDLFVSGGVNAFEEKSATTSGDSVTFNATDTSSVNKGITTVDVQQLAQKDVYQTNSLTTALKDANVDKGELTIQVKGETHTFDTNGKTYQQLTDEINAKTGINASLDQVGSDSFRMIIKSADSGLENALSFGGAAASSLGFDVTENHTVVAKDLKALVDGVEYNVSSNSLKVDGLEISASKLGVSSINIVDDTSQIETKMQNFVTKFNELVDMVDTATNADSKISNKSGLRDIVSQIKNKLFGMYGENSDKSVFNYGLELNKSGKISLDTAKFTKAVKEDLAGLKDLFIGKAEKEGLGTQIKSTIDQMKFTGGVMNVFDSSLKTRESTLTEDKTKAQEALDNKYKQLALQFASYGAIINNFESSFSGLKLLINQSTAKQ